MPSKLFFNYQRIREKVAAACRKSGRKEKDVLIIAVSKNRSGKEIRVAYEVGMRHFGENRVQEVSYISRNLKVLARELNVPVLAAACSAASIYLVIPENMTKEARCALAESFLVPDRSAQ